MNHHFPLPQGGELLLHRYPRPAQHGLQAWDAADEYIITELMTREWDQTAPLLILNDGFGALTLALHHHRPYSLTDSRISELAMDANARDNGLEKNWLSLNSLAELPGQPGLVLMKLPKTNAMLEYQLAALSQVMGPDTRLVVGAKARDIHSSTLKLFEHYIGPTHTSLAWKKARLIFCQRDGSREATPLPAPLSWPLEGTGFTIHNHANVFSRISLDIGARFMLEHLPANRPDRIIDLGCGNGVLGLTALARNPDAEVTFVDESYMAMASARLNVSENLPEAGSRARFMVNNCLDGMAADSADLILCNPPFHQQQAITDHIAWQMFVDAKRVLRRGGELLLVANRHLDYHQKLKRLFGNQRVVASNRKFVILRAIKTS
ncbi:methyltransferase [Oceanisphaera psychrotolerans]|uniref:Ribosomal RNA large subunit methyltransferase G n=1 Tax=Oceanisphaera psychrotolerans TaxID=1414654 RepID=A0A1J4QGB8_9GAMM|nr:methyltransferase [Oceanisphaera psychrotolerans]OIN13790.1 23S rRNA (guanine(1835)-N(2))-methyltransferase [Oceanisphaera psychrotolerans]